MSWENVSNFIVCSSSDGSRCGLVQWLYDWQQGWGGIIAASLALLAAWLTIRATNSAAKEQVAAADRQTQAALDEAWKERERQKRRDRRDRNREAGSIALIIMHELHRFQGELEILRLESDINRLAVEVPAIVMQRADKLWVLGAAADNFLHMIGIIEMNRAAVNQIRTHLRAHVTKQKYVDEAVSLAQERLTSALAECMAGRGHLEKLVDSLDLVPGRIRSAETDED